MSLEQSIQPPSNNAPTRNSNAENPFVNLSPSKFGGSKGGFNSLHQTHHATSKNTNRGKFVVYSQAEAKGEKTKGLSARAIASTIPTQRLVTSYEQALSVAALYRDGKIQDSLYLPESAENQAEAKHQLTANDLDMEARGDLPSRWSIQWKDTTGKKKGGFERVLYQCKCGYDDESAGTKTRRVTFPYTGCLAHAEVTYELDSLKVLRIRGFLDHNEACRSAKMSNEPTHAVHPAVWKVALDQLGDGSTWSEIMAKNRKYVLGCLYPGQTADWAYSPYRWLLNKKDSRSLYRQAQRKEGVDVNERPHRNIDSWLNPSSPEYNPVLAEAVFFYSARASTEERLKICIATPEMKEAAWRYGHNQQILLDGTFGVCNSKILLFILMGLDEEKKGVPLAFLLFSAPSGNKFTPAGYDTEILTELLSQWKSSLGLRDGSAFHSPVAITDTDLKERNALLAVFPNIWLLLCKFHVRQAWKNHRSQLLKTNSPATGVGEVRIRLSRLEDELIRTKSHEDALLLVATERSTLEQLKTVDPTAVFAADGGIAHLDYLSVHWINTIEIWKSWSDHGRNIAAGILGCSFDWVLPTTNHLESFNNLLKNKHLRRWQRNGRRVRIDVLVNILITKVLPSIFEQRNLDQIQRRAWEARLRRAGAEHLIKRSGTASLRGPGIAWLSPDETRDAAATALFERNQIGAPELDFSEPTARLTFQCNSAFALDAEVLPTVYTITMEVDGAATCSCGDFTQRGGSCKHIRAALKRLDALRDQGKNVPHVPIPTSIDAARILEATRVARSVEKAVVTANGQAGPLIRAVQVVDDLLHVGDGIYEGEDARSDREEEGGFDGSQDELLSDDECPDPTIPSRLELTSDMDISEYSSAVDGQCGDEDGGGSDEEVGESERRCDGKKDDGRGSDQTVVGTGSSAVYEHRAGDAQAAVNAQALLRTFHDLESVGPRLLDIAERLQYAHLNKKDDEDRHRAEVALTHVEALAAQLKRLVIEAQAEHQTNAVPEICVARPPTPPKKTVKRTARDADLSAEVGRTKGWDTKREIYAADLEVKQKRKPSHGYF